MNTFCKSDCTLPKLLNNKYVTPVLDGQLIEANNFKGNKLFQIWNKYVKPVFRVNISIFNMFI